MKKLILLVGPPCSGKTHYCNCVLKDCTRISQDDMGKIGHMDQLVKAIEDGVENVVIDRMNFNKMQRKRYIDLADDNCHVQVVILNFSTPILHERLANRSSHPTIQDVETGKKVIKFFQDNYEEPSLDEGIDEIVRV